MSPRASPRPLISLLLLGLTCVQAPAQDAIAPPLADDALETYLAERDLSSVLAAHFRRKLVSDIPEERVRAAEALGRLYVKMLGEVTDAAARQSLEAQCRSLLETVPEAESFELRLNLAKATYLQVEEIVERERLRLADPADRVEAQRVLRVVTPAFEEIAQKVGRKVDVLEKREPFAKEDEIELLRAELTDARRLRSLSRYYAGWAGYYDALLNAEPRRAQQALVDFGVILNAVPGRPASIERMPKEFLRFEHVARAGVGCALAASLLGNDVEAERWLDAVEAAEDLHPAVQAQIFSRRLMVAASARHWADIDLRVRRRRQPVPGQPEQRLGVSEARLLGVLALTASRDPATRPPLRAVAEKMAQIALADLVETGQVAHVLDLVKQFGTAPIGDEGFIVAYIRGLLTFERAREAHAAGGDDPDAPTTQAAVANLYHESASLLAAAAASSDAQRFPIETGKAGIREGLAFFYAGDFLPAAERFQRTADASSDTPTRRDALWYAIIALDRAIDAGRASQAASRDRLATLYLQEFPGSDNAARLLLRQTRADRLGDAKAAEILLAVPSASPMHSAARRQAARLLYSLYKRSGEPDRDFAALRFAQVAEEVLAWEHAAAMSDDPAPAREAASAVVLRVRQLADTLLGVAAPDLPRVQAALDILDAVESRHNLDLRELKPELDFRRMQLALARNDEAQARRLADELRSVPGPFGAAADRLLYRLYLARWKASPADNAAARDVIGSGMRVIAALEHAGARPADPSLVTLRDSVADAAASVFRASDEGLHRDLAIRLDKAQLESGQRTGPSLRRLGELLESAGDLPGAAQAWQELLAGTPAATDAWFEARYHSIRLLAASSPSLATQAMAQFKALHPDMGPEAWRDKFQALDLTLVAPIPPIPPAPPGGGR